MESILSGACGGSYGCAISPHDPYRRGSRSHQRSVRRRKDTSPCRHHGRAVCTGARCLLNTHQNYNVISRMREAVANSNSTCDPSSWLVFTIDHVMIRGPSLTLSLRDRADSIGTDGTERHMGFTARVLGSAWRITIIKTRRLRRLVFRLHWIHDDPQCSWA